MKLKNIARLRLFLSSLKDKRTTEKDIENGKFLDSIIKEAQEILHDEYLKCPRCGGFVDASGDAIKHEL